MDNPSLHKLKRKRVGSSASESSVGERATTKPRLNDSDQASTTNTNGLSSTTIGAQSEIPTDSTIAAAPSQSTVSQPLHNGNVTPAADMTNDPVQKPAARPKLDIEKLRETIDAQLSLEVLLKHNELRLIDQEIAKCQVALEQLRRCAEIPYPGSSISGVSQSVSNGTGEAVLQPGNGPAPLSPAPWGVTDGPYSRHYAKWLIPDPRFDGGEVETPPTTAGLASLDGRATRGSLTESGYVAGKSRSQRGSGTMKLQALSSGYPQPKEKAGPMIIKRKSDGQLVKLVCLDCRRDNFSSTQGFINHCRIAHNRNFASHDAAAMASGEPVEVDEAGMVVGGNTTESTSGGTPGYVHPLIRSAHMMESMSKTNTQRKPSAESQTPKQQRNSQSPRVVTKDEKPSTPAAANFPFTASPDTPHLSSLMQRRGIGLNLSEIVGDAKTSLDLDAMFSDEESSDSVTDAAPNLDEPPPNVRASRLPARTTMPQAASQRPSSRKGQDKASHGSQHLGASTPARPVSYASSFPPTSGLGISHEEPRDMDMGDPSMNLSPNTMESNQAPSLVSDDDEYEAASESESPSPSSSDGDDDVRDFSHIEVGDDEDANTSTTATTETKTEPGLASPARRPAAPLSKPLKRSNGKKKDRHGAAPVLPVSRAKDEKRVSFASPETSPSKTKGDGGRKQHR
ncbi:hypothetical protein NFIA_016080 [Paecilomyces variotii No. 5]|uniref:AHC1-like C2H2 zinc-finger domain-containing protein n=1 Tax=Byssochlamys spectabilis (strain No. 5 / NBRC 109023) TaxID=1356009 RepID=V5FTE2_BYSSN|nr:hypothetical protein NFIA_016080 [Paecilomyces variotii No. 5]